MKAKLSGFTLIELLIVVAIIAILAAIAVPNFLEAQTRSKVARTISDMRSLVTAIEAYRVDYNMHPWDGSTIGLITYLQFEAYTGLSGGAGHRLTTPVSYMSSIPWDVFNSNLHATTMPHNWQHRVKNASVFIRAAPSPANPPSTCCAWIFSANGRYEPFNYMLSSAGPDRVPWPQNSGSNMWVGWAYDPTNGTVSVGDINYFDTKGFIGAGANRSGN